MNSAEWRLHNIGRYLNNAVRRFENRVMDLLAQAGHGELHLTHINLTRNLDLDGTRISELARRAAMTKQSMGELVQQLERLGFVERGPDPHDGRARLVKFTRQGRVWLEAFHNALEQAQQEMEQELGSKAFRILRDCLADYSNGCDQVASRTSRRLARTGN